MAVDCSSGPGMTSPLTMPPGAPVCGGGVFLDLHGMLASGSVGVLVPCDPPVDDLWAASHTALRSLSMAASSWHRFSSRIATVLGSTADTFS